MIKTAEYTMTVLAAPSVSAKKIDCPPPL